MVLFNSTGCSWFLLAVLVLTSMIGSVLSLQKAYLKTAHVNSVNPGYKTGDCPPSPDGAFGWHFIQSGTSTSFVSINCTFKRTGTVTNMIQSPSDKHAYVYTPTGDTILGAWAMVEGPNTEFILSHVCASKGGSTPINPCQTNNGGCDLNANCIFNSTTNTKSCICKLGYTNTGTATSVQCAQVCKVNNGGCGNNAACSFNNATNTVQCSCYQGYKNTATSGPPQCTEVCRVNNGDCGNNAACSFNNVTNTVQCSCYQGFKKISVEGGVECTEVCRVKNGGCDDNALCTFNNVSNKIECSCNRGYVNTGVDGSVECTEVCNVKNGGCGDHALCAYDPLDNTVECTCEKGYKNTGTGSAVQCTAIATGGDEPVKNGTDVANPCKANNGGCDINAACLYDVKLNTVDCSCNMGYSNTGTNGTVICTEVCKIGNGGCRVNARCVYNKLTDRVRCLCQKRNKYRVTGLIG